MGLPDFNYYCPETLAELEGFLNDHKGQAKILAGGTDLVIQIKDRIQSPGVLIDIGNLAALQGIT